MKKLYSIVRVRAMLAMFAVCCAPIAAAGVDVQVLQTSQVKGVAEQTLVIEDAVMNAMFDAGHIVTNEAAAPVGEANKKTILQRAMKNAIAGGAKYFVQFTVHYRALSGAAAPKAPEAILMANIEGMDWAVYDARSALLLAQGSEEAVKPAKDGADSVMRYATEVAKIAAIHCSASAPNAHIDGWR